MNETTTRGKSGRRIPAATAWSRGELSVVGQIVEFLVWAELAAQSAGRLHVFLPLWDRGIDAVVHRRTDGTYIPVQVKSRSQLMDGEVHLVIRDESLTDDHALIIGALLDGDHLGPRLLVVDEGAFKRLATRSDARVGLVFSAGFAMEPRANSRWLPYLVAREDLAAQLGDTRDLMPTLEPEATEPRTDPRDVGSLAEAEVVRRLVEIHELNLFRPFPDSETAEIVVRHTSTNRIAGLQVKSIGIDPHHVVSTVTIRRSSFRPAPDTWMIALAWLRDQDRFHPQYLLIPTIDIESFARPQRNSLRFHYRPGSSGHGRLDRYRRPLEELGRDVASLLSPPKDPTPKRPK